MSTRDTSTTYGGNSCVSFVLLRSNVFIRNARKIMKKQPPLVQNLQEALELLQIDAIKMRARKVWVLN